MAIPSKNVIERERKRVNALKSKFEKALKARFHTWQVDVYREFRAQIRRGASITILSPDLKKDLRKILIDHYQTISETNIPGLSFSNQRKQEENEDDNGFDWLMPGIFANILKGLNAQIALNLPIHEGSIVNTTERIGTESVALSKLDEGGDPLVIMANKLAARETTVSLTETNWIFEASLATALLSTTPAIEIADERQLREIQKISPNITLKELDIGKAFAVPAVIDKVKRQLAVPTKTWITMNDPVVRSSHVAVAGNTIPSKEAFSLRGGLLLFPGDSSLGVAFGETVNCRCYALYS